MREDFYEDYYREETRHWWFCARRRIIETLLRRHRLTEPTPVIADIGCGPGASLEMLRRLGQPLGIDTSSRALVFCRERGETRLVCGGLPDLPIRDNSADIVCAFDVIEHVDDDRAAVENLVRVCKPGGIVFVTVPAHPSLWSEHDEINQHKRRYRRTQLAALARNLPVEVLQLSYYNFLLAPFVIAFRLLKRAMAKPKAPAAATSDLSVPHPVVNGFLESLFASERWWLARGSFPFGISLLCILRKLAL